MKPLSVFIVTGLLFVGLSAFAMSAQALEAEKLETLEQELSIEDYDSADSLFELEPVSRDYRIFFTHSIDFNSIKETITRLGFLA